MDKEPLRRKFYIAGGVLTVAGIVPLAMMYMGAAEGPVTPGTLYAIGPLVTTGLVLLAAAIWLPRR